MNTLLFAPARLWGTPVGFGIGRFMTPGEIYYVGDRLVRVLQRLRFALFWPLTEMRSGASSIYRGTHSRHEIACPGCGLGYNGSGGQQQTTAQHINEVRARWI